MYSHEEYTIAQSLRTRGALGSDHEFLLTGTSSPPELSSNNTGRSNSKMNNNNSSSSSESSILDKGVSSSSSTTAAVLGKTRHSSSSSATTSRFFNRPATSSSTNSGGGKTADECNDEDDDDDNESRHRSTLADTRRSNHREGLGLISSASSMGYGRGERPETAGSTGSNFSFSSAESRPNTAQLTRQGSSSSVAAASGGNGGGGGGSSSDLTFGDASVLFVGNAAKSLRMQRVGTANSLSSSVAHSASFDMDPLMTSSSSLELSGFGFGGSSTPAASSVDQSMLSAKSGLFADDVTNTSINVSTSTAPPGRSDGGANDDVRNRPSTAPVRGRAGTSTFLSSSSSLSSVGNQSQQQQQLQQQQQPVVAVGGYAAALKLFLAAPTPGSKSKGDRLQTSSGAGRQRKQEQEEDDDEEEEEDEGQEGKKGEADVMRRENRPRRFSEDLHTFSMRDQLKSAGAASAIKAKTMLATSKPSEETTVNVAAAVMTTAAVAPFVAAVASTSREAVIGPGVEKSDEVLVDMLRKKPKLVPEIHNRESFRRFFSGFPKARFLMLLQKADAMKRLELVEDVLG